MCAVPGDERSRGPHQNAYAPRLSRWRWRCPGQPCAMPRAPRACPFRTAAPRRHCQKCQRWPIPTQVVVSECTCEHVAIKKAPSKDLVESKAVVAGPGVLAWLTTGALLGRLATPRAPQGWVAWQSAALRYGHHVKESCRHSVMWVVWRCLCRTTSTGGEGIRHTVFRSASWWRGVAFALQCAFGLDNVHGLPHRVRHVVNVLSQGWPAVAAAGCAKHIPRAVGDRLHNILQRQLICTAMYTFHEAHRFAQQPLLLMRGQPLLHGWCLLSEQTPTRAGAHRVA